MRKLFDDFKDDEMIAFDDIRPAGQAHYLIIPKQHIDSVLVLDKDHIGLRIKFVLI